MTKNTNMTNLNIRISEELKEQLREIAQQDDRSITYVVTQAIHEYLDKLEKEKE